MSAADRAKASRRAQGLPEQATDPALLARTAALLTAAPVEVPEREAAG